MTTRTKTTSRTKTAEPATVPEDYNFDSWTEADEEAAVAAIATAVEVRYIVLPEGLFVARFPDGRVLRTPVQIPMEAIAQINALEDDDPATQIKTVLAMLGQDEDLAYLERVGILTVVDYARKYFKVFSRVMGISLGE